MVGEGEQPTLKETAEKKEELYEPIKSDSQKNNSSQIDGESKPAAWPFAFFLSAVNVKLKTQKMIRSKQRISLKPMVLFFRRFTQRTSLFA